MIFEVSPKQLIARVTGELCLSGECSIVLMICSFYRDGFTVRCHAGFVELVTLYYVEF